MNPLKQQIEKKAYSEDIATTVVALDDVLQLLKNYMCIPRKQLEEIIEAMPEALDKKYEYRDVNGLKQIRLYDFLSNLRTWKKKLEELLEDSKKKE